MANNFEVILPLSAFLPASTNGPAQGCLATYDRPFLAFDDTTVETCQLAFPVQMPDAYTGAGTLRLDLWYIAASATTGSVAVRAYVEAITSGDSLDLDAAESYDAANQGNSTVPATAGHAKLLTITLANKDGVAAGDYVRIKIDRFATDGTNDTATGDLRILNVVLREEA